MIEIISLIGAIISTALISYFNGIYGELIDILWIVLILYGTFVAFIALFMIAGYIISAVVDINKPIKKPSKFHTFVYYLYLSFLNRSFNIKFIVEGEDKLPEGKCVFVMNHRSNFDPMLLAQKYKKRNILMVSKPGNFRIPIAGGVIHKMGYLAIDRDNDREALKVILKAVDYIKQGYSIGIYPEGTRHKDGLDLLPFRHGSFKIAVKANVPIVVTAIHNTQEIHKNFPFKRTRVYLHILKTIYPEEYAGKTTAEISDEVAALMTEDIERFEAEKAAKNK